MSLRLPLLIFWATCKTRLRSSSLSRLRALLIFLNIRKPLPREALRRLRAITRSRADIGSGEDRDEFSRLLAQAIAPRNIAGLFDPTRKNLYPVDFAALTEQHQLLDLSRGEILEAIPRLRRGSTLLSRGDSRHFLRGCGALGTPIEANQGP